MKLSMHVSAVPRAPCPSSASRERARSAYRDAREWNGSDASYIGGAAHRILESGTPRQYRDFGYGLFLQ